MMNNFWTFTPPLILENILNFGNLKLLDQAGLTMQATYFFDSDVL